MSPRFLERVGASLESLVYGPLGPYYRRFVLALLVVTALLAVGNGLIIAEVVGVSPGVADLLWAAGGVAFALFALTAVVQLVVLGRTLERGTEEVAETAAELGTAAEAVEATAADLEDTANTVESAAEVVDESVAEEVQSKAAEAKATTETVKQQASEVKETVESERKRLPADVDPDEETDER